MNKNKYISRLKLLVAGVPIECKMFCNNPLRNKYPIRRKFFFSYLYLSICTLHNSILFLTKLTA